MRLARALSTSLAPTASSPTHSLLCETGGSAAALMRVDQLQRVRSRDKLCPITKETWSSFVYESCTDSFEVPILHRDALARKPEQRTNEVLGSNLSPAQTLSRLGNPKRNACIVTRLTLPSATLINCLTTVLLKIADSDTFDGTVTNYLSALSPDTGAIAGSYS